MKNLVSKQAYNLPKWHFFLIFSVLFSSPLFSQKSVQLDPKIHSYYKDSLIEITYQYGNCNLIFDGINKDEVYLKIQNLSDQEVDLSWELVLTYNNRCYNCDRENDELKFKTTLKPNETLQGKCEEEGNPYLLKIFSGFVNNESEAKLKEFDIKYLTAKIHEKQ